MKGKTSLKLLVILCLLLFLMGCKAEASEVTEITFIHGWGSTEADHESMRQIYRDFEAENPDIRINMISMPTSDEVVRKAEDMIMVGTVPDIIFLGGKGIDSIYEYMVENNYALDLAPHMEADPEFASNLAPSNVEYWTTEDGALYSVSDVLILGGGYWYNEKIFRAVGITEPPQTWDEFETTCMRIDQWAEREENGVHAMQLSAEGYLYFMDHILASMGTSVLDGKLEMTYEELTKALDILNRLHGYSAGKDGNYTYRDETSLFNAGKLAIYVNGVWGAAMIHQNMEASYALLPAGENSICCESAGSGYILGNTGDAMRQEASVRFLKYMMSPAVQERILLETQQMAANPNLNIRDYADQMPRFCQAVATAQQARIKIEIPEQLWSNQQSAVFYEHIYDLLNGAFNRQTFYDLLR